MTVLGSTVPQPGQPCMNINSPMSLELVAVIECQHAGDQHLRALRTSSPCMLHILTCLCVQAAVSNTFLRGANIIIRLQLPFHLAGAWGHCACWDTCIACHHVNNQLGSWFMEQFGSYTGHKWSCLQSNCCSRVPMSSLQEVMSDT